MAIDPTTQINPEGRRVPREEIDDKPDEVKSAVVDPETQISADGNRHPIDELDGTELPREAKSEGVNPDGSETVDDSEENDAHTGDAESDVGAVPGAVPAPDLAAPPPPPTEETELAATPEGNAGEGTEVTGTTEVTGGDASVGEVGGEPQPASTEETSTAPSSQPAADEKPLEQMTRAELYDVATEFEIEGRSGMDKGELLDAIKAKSAS